MYNVNYSRKLFLKMEVWEDRELASPHTKAPAGRWWGTPDTQGDGRNPKVNQ